MFWDGLKWFTQRGTQAITLYARVEGDLAGKLRNWQVTRAGTRWRGHGAVSLYLKQGRCGLERRMLHEVGIIVRFVVPKKLCLDSCRMSW